MPMLLKQPPVTESAAGALVATTTTTAMTTATTTAQVQPPQANQEEHQQLNKVSKPMSPTPSLNDPVAAAAAGAMGAGSTKKPINYKNGRKVEPVMFNYTNYYKHREKLPQHFHPLLQYLESTEVKYHNDNLFANSTIGLPTRAQLLKERVYHLPVLRESSVEKSRYRRKLEENKQNILSARKKYDFRTFDQFSSHYFLTGARFNRNDTIDSKILNKYGVFINRQNPDLLYIKSNKKALESFNDDLNLLSTYNKANHAEKPMFQSKSVQVTAAMFRCDVTNSDAAIQRDTTIRTANC